MKEAHKSYRWWQPQGFDRATLTRVVLSIAAWYVGSLAGTVWADHIFDLGMLSPYETFAATIGALGAPGSGVLLLATSAWCLVYILRKLPVWGCVITAAGCAAMTYVEAVSWRSR
jgi:hypothetical protein